MEDVEINPHNIKQAPRRNKDEILNIFKLIKILNELDADDLETILNFIYDLYEDIRKERKQKHILDKLMNSIKQHKETIKLDDIHYVTCDAHDYMEDIHNIFNNVLK